MTVASSCACKPRTVPFPSFARRRLRDFPSMYCSRRRSLACAPLNKGNLTASLNTSATSRRGWVPPLTGSLHIYRLLWPLLRSSESKHPTDALIHTRTWLPSLSSYHVFWPTTWCGLVETPIAPRQSLEGLPPKDERGPHEGSYLQPDARPRYRGLRS
ncbi:hypothetical protein BC834DRAFT_902886 [Gloeopeniophorella convolvens]|nr:hypothetical protein BC834DRAFT_902886 [Gloeopeniophorella convolvens]